MIRLHVPDITEIEEFAMVKTLRSGWVSTAGPDVNEFEKIICEYTGSRFAVAFNSGTAALQIALIAAGIQPGDLVLVPELAYIATLNAIHHSGAIPFLMDVNLNDGQMDVSVLQEFLEMKTRQLDGACYHSQSGKKIGAVLPLWAWGNLCEIEKIVIFANQYSIPVIEDAAAAMGSMHNRKHAGTVGKAGILSFNGNKIMTTGGGGIILTSDESIAQRALHLSVQAKIPGTEYIHDQYGFNNRMTSLAAALGIAQLSRLPSFLARKKQISGIYRAEFSPIEQISFFPDSEMEESNHWLFQISVNDPEKLQRYLSAREIETSRIWVPMSELKLNSGMMHFLPHQNAKKCYSRVLSLPSSSTLKDSELEFAISDVKKFFM